MNYIGVDIGGTEVKLGLIDEQGTVLISERYNVAFDQYETPILDTVMKSLDLFLVEKNIALKELKGIGVSATGQIDILNGVVAGTAGHIKNWQDSRIKETMIKRYKLPVTVINDANCAALAEKWVGAARNATDVIVVTIGTGVGGGIIVNSELLTGQNGFAGELGHLSICNQGQACTCGNIGCYEQYASTTALVRMVKAAVLNGAIPENSLNDNVINGKTIFKLLSEHNPNLQKVVDEWLGYVSDGLVNLVHIFNPQLILLGGGISAQKQLFIEPVRKKVLERVMPVFRHDLELKPAELGNDAGMVGAVYYCMNSLQKEWEPLEE